MSERPVLKTERLVLRPFDIADAPEVKRLAGERIIADTTLNIPHPYEDGMAEAWIGRHQQVFDEGAGINFAVTLKADDRLVGSFSLMNIAAGHQAELGYWIGHPYWNQGYCTEAALAIVDFAFTGLGLIRVHARHLSRNPASGRVMLKIGMQHEGTLRKHVIKWDKPEDIELYGLLKEEWTKKA